MQSEVLAGKKPQRLLNNKLNKFNQVEVRE